MARNTASDSLVANAARQILVTQRWIRLSRPYTFAELAIIHDLRDALRQLDHARRSRDSELIFFWGGRANALMVELVTDRIVR